MSIQNNTDVIVMTNGKRIRKINGFWHFVSAGSVRAGRMDEWSQASEAYAEWLEEKYASQGGGNPVGLPWMPTDRDLILAYGTYEQFKVIELCWKAFNAEYPHVLGAINAELDSLMLPMEPSKQDDSPPEMTTDEKLVLYRTARAQAKQRLKEYAASIAIT